MGPEGYRRSDERILDDVSERLTRHGHIDARQISVGVTEGEVILIAQCVRAVKNAWPRMWLHLSQAWSM
jgi:osmotically-inducible protein OsmY